MPRGPYLDRGPVRDEARRLRTTGLGYRAIQKLLVVKVSIWTVRNWVQDIQVDSKKAHHSACIEFRRPFSELKTNAHRRKALIRERGHRCERCLLEEWLGEPIPLELEHVGGNRSDNRKESLKLLCPNCHALTPNWKGRSLKGRKRSGSVVQ